jgi:hypothetical protein
MPTVTNAYTQESFIDTVKVTLAAQLPKPGYCLADIPHHHLVAHVDGKHTVIVSEVPDNWYPKTHVWVYTDRIVKPDEVAITKAPRHADQSWLVAVPKGWRLHVSKDMSSCDEQYNMCMGQSGTDTISVAEDGEEPKTVAKARVSWHMEKEDRNYFRLETGDGLGGADAVDAVAADIGARVFGDADVFTAADGGKGESKIWDYQRWDASFGKMHDAQHMWAMAARKQFGTKA